jgi:hypothetical protein
MPGAHHALPKGATCDSHPDRPAVARVQGETDSFGSELNDMCAECLAEHREYCATADTSGICDWCKQPADKLFNRRDYDEGMAGRLYEVCRPCIAKDEEYWRQEAEEMEHRGGYDFYDDDF